MASTPARPGRDDTERLKAELVERYCSGSSLAEISREVGRSYGFVRKRLIEAGVTLRPRGGPRQRHDESIPAPGHVEGR